MANKSKKYLVRRGQRYLIERRSDGTFVKWLPINKTRKVKRSIIKKK
jgi:hypothetical protein